MMSVLNFSHLRFSLLLLLCSFAVAQDQPAEDLVGRLLLLAFSGDSAPLEQLESIEPAGFIFYPSNVTSTEGVRQLTRKLEDAAGYPLLFAIDQEGGPFNSYRVDDATIFPGNMALAATGKPDLAREAARAIGTELAYAGLNMSFGPAVDVNINPDNPIIGIRSFGAEVAQVSDFGVAYLEGLEAAGIAAVAKHFPGHGDTATDSHLALPSVEGDRARLDEVELPPFEAMISAGVPAVMTAHVAFPAVEADLPATLSAAALTDLLKTDLGFDGLVMTDYMDMKAIADNYGPGEAAVRSVLAGADLVLLGPDRATQQAVYNALQEALRNGRLSAERVQEAAARSTTVAERYRPQWEAEAPDYAAHRELAAQIAGEAATLLWNDGVLPLHENARVLVIAPTPSSFGAPPHLGEVLARHHANTTLLAIGEAPDQTEIDTALARAQDADVVVLGSYHWFGGFPESLKTLEADLVATGKPVVNVALGNPDDLRFFDLRPSAYLAVYGYREANLEGASRVLTGQLQPQGRLPLPVAEFDIGAGLKSFE